MMTILPRPTASVSQWVCPRLESRTPHLGTNSLGRLVRPRPKRSLICVVKIVTAIPAVKPRMMG